jgi:hypothetical protein
MIKLENNHTLLNLTPMVREASNAFLNSHGLNYFQYLRCYKDGSISFLLSDPSLFLRFTHLDAPVIFLHVRKVNLNCNRTGFRGTKNFRVSQLP